MSRFSNLIKEICLDREILNPFKFDTNTSPTRPELLSNSNYEDLLVHYLLLGKWDEIIFTFSQEGSRWQFCESFYYISLDLAKIYSTRTCPTHSGSWTKVLEPGSIWVKPIRVRIDSFVFDWFFIEKFSQAKVLVIQ